MFSEKGQVTHRLRCSPACSRSLWRGDGAGDGKADTKLRMAGGIVTVFTSLFCLSYKYYDFFL